MAMLRMLMSLAAIAMLLGSAMATNYTVGGPNGGWDQSTDAQAWAASKTFFVGDNLSKPSKRLTFLELVKLLASIFPYRVWYFYWTFEVMPSFVFSRQFFHML